MENKKPISVDEYIAGFSEDVQKKLNDLRATVKKAAPDAEESLSYGIIGYKLHGKLIWFAAYKNHIGLYPTYGLEKFENEMTRYKAKSAKSSLHLPLDKPMPLDLIQKIVLFRAAENLKK